MDAVEDGVERTNAAVRIKEKQLPAFTDELMAPTNHREPDLRFFQFLLLAEKLKQKVRLTGVSAQSLVGEGGQLPLFDSDRRVGRLNAVLDRIHDKFGSDAVTTADLHAAPGKKRE